MNAVIVQMDTVTCLSSVFLPPHHSFFFSSMETPPGPRATTNSRPPITDVVWKKSYLRKSCMGLYDGMVQKALKVKLMQSSQATRVRAASFVLKPTATRTISAVPTRFCRIWTRGQSLRLGFTHTHTVLFSNYICSLQGFWCLQGCYEFSTSAVEPFFHLTSFCLSVFDRSEMWRCHRVL